MQSAEHYLIFPPPNTAGSLHLSLPTLPPSCYCNRLCLRAALPFVLGILFLSLWYTPVMSLSCDSFSHSAARFHDAYNQILTSPILKIFFSHPGWCGLSTGLETKGSPVWFPVRAHAWVAGQVPRGGAWEAATHWCFSPSLSLSLTLSLKISK